MMGFVVNIPKEDFGFSVWIIFILVIMFLTALMLYPKIFVIILDFMFSSDDGDKESKI